MDGLAHVFDSIGTPRVLVLGDLILDRYSWGAAERVSPEAPVLVLRAEHDEVRLGGAASVAMLLAALDVSVVLAGVVGDDSAGRTIVRLLDDAHIDQELVLIDPDRQTTVKERIVGRTAGRQPHQIVRLDRESRQPIDRELEQELIEGIARRLADYQAICVADYNKGVCTPRLLHAVLIAAAARGVPVIVDPARMTDYTRYRRAALVKPNRVEAELASGLPIVTPDDAIVAGRKISRRFHLPAILITLDADGMVLAGKENAGQHFPTTPREVCDVTGAGDMALAALGLGAAAGLPWPDTVRLANVAAGLQVERFGVAAISRAELAVALRNEGGVVWEDGLPSPSRQTADGLGRLRFYVFCRCFSFKMLGQLYRRSPR
jgi:D-beta-D-heptose 7-phosphate kinase / D-beta-D-heptose 1-phosphate adenosyltransferase